ncbi:MAG: hypothetical protein CML33_03675 [Rhodobacteraceae bacterium]|nr:hypothetical protein [Paracoccaceae bacterium]
MDRAKIGIIGAGVIAKAHIEALATNRAAIVAGVVSRGYSSAIELATEFDTMAFRSVSEMLEATTLDGLVIAVNVEQTAAVVEECLTFNLKILAEKPIALDLERADRLVRLAKGASSDIFVAHNRRFYQSTVKLIDELQGINSQRSVVVFDQEDPKEAIDVFGEAPSVAAKSMYANSIHQIDFFNIICRGEIINVDVIEPWSGSETRSVVAKISYDSGDSGIYIAAWSRPGPWSVQVFTDERFFQMAPVEELSAQSRFTRVKETLAEEKGPVKPGFEGQAHNFVSACLGEAHGLVSLSESHRTMQLISKIYAE